MNLFRYQIYISILAIKSLHPYLSFVILALLKLTTLHHYRDKPFAVYSQVRLYSGQVTRPLTPDFAYGDFVS
jgi:hypothetical protein